METGPNDGWSDIYCFTWFCHHPDSCCGFFRDRRSDRPSAKEVVNALLQEEKVAKQQRLTYPLESLLGHWRLLYCSSPSSSKRWHGIAGFFMCLRLLCTDFLHLQHQVRQSLGQAEIGNQIQFGSGCLNGPAQYLGKKNLLAFDLPYAALGVWSLYSGEFRGGKEKEMNFYDQPIAKLLLCVLLGDWRLHCRSRSWRWTSALG